MTYIPCFGDMFTKTRRPLVMAHGCNCAGAMGKGIAVQFKREWPDMYDKYKRMCKAGEFVLGDVFVHRRGEEVVFNLATQEHWKTPATLSSVAKSCLNLRRKAEEMLIPQVTLPLVGSGLGGLSQREVSILMQGAFQDSQVQFFVVENFVEGHPTKRKTFIDSKEPFR